MGAWSVDSNGRRARGRGDHWLGVGRCTNSESVSSRGNQRWRGEALSGSGMIGSGATGGVDDRVDVRGRRPVARRGNARLDWHWRMAGNGLPVENGWRNLRE
jgi:hypothetical protein